VIALTSTDCEYPEHDKLRQVSGASQGQGELLEWLRSQGVCLMRWKTWTEQVQDDCPRCGHWDEQDQTWRTPCGSPEILPRRVNCADGSGKMPPRDVEREGWVSDDRSIQVILAEYHGIDLGKLEDEKRAMLRDLRECQSADAA